MMQKQAMRLLGILLLCSTSACVNNPILVVDTSGFLPIFYVVENPVNPTRARLLAQALGIDTNIIAEDGSIRYMDKDLFQALPMIPMGQGPNDEDGNVVTQENFDFAAIKALKPMADQEALSKANAALEQAGLSPKGNKARLGHSRFQAVSANGEPVADVLLDTQVDFDTVTPNGYPLRGPGAEIKMVFDGQSRVTQLQYSFRTLAEGSRASVLSVQQAQRRVAAEYFKVDQNRVSLREQCASAQGMAGKLCLHAEVVYYAPPIDLPINQISPHYLFTGNFVVDNNSIEVRRLLIPAVANAPEVTMSLGSDGASAVHATASASGGRGPYSYVWTSSSTTLPSTETGASLNYTVAGREAVAHETLSVVVTDADGISAWTSQTVDVNAPAVALVRRQATQKHSVGAEWVGISQNLPFSGDNVSGFIDQASKAGESVAFNFGETAAYQSDFVKGSDAFGIDSVDLGFYTGHANGLGFSFDSLHTKRFLYSDQASWGEKELEWLIIAACGPLQETQFGIQWWQQWGKAFNGLHLMLAYANTTYDNNREGRIFGQGIFEKGLMLRQAWANTAANTQTPDEIYAVMGVWGANGLNDYNDHFWGFGPVGPDIPGSSVAGFWRLSGPS